MAHWVIRLDDVFKPLINLMREVQNSGDYLQADESRMNVLKEDGKTAQSDKWMWVTRGGPPGQPSVLFEYDPSRAGKVLVLVRLLDDFKGILQADGYSGYGKVCRNNGITRIGCWDHARRKFVEATKGDQVSRQRQTHERLQSRCGSRPHQQALRHRAQDQSVECEEALLCLSGIECAWPEHTADLAD